MIIQTDEEGKKHIIDLCDVALKVGGLGNYKAVTSVLKSLEPVHEEVPSDA